MTVCSDKTLTNMTQAEFDEHLKEVATKIKNKVADRVAADLLDLAEREQAKEAGDAHESPDAGDMTREEVLAKYNIDLLTFSPADADAAAKQLKDTDLVWIVEQFANAGMIPAPKDAGVRVDYLSSICGKGEVQEIEFTSQDKPKDGEDNLAALSENISAGKGLLGDSVFNKCSTIADTVIHWDSDAATSFKDRMLPAIAAVVVNQIVAAKTLRSLMAVNQGMLLAGRRNFDEIVHNGLAAVESFEGCISDSSGDVSIQTVLGITSGLLTTASGVLAVAAGLAAAPGTAGTGLAISAGGVSIVTGGLSTLQNALDIETEDLPMGAHTIEDVVYNISEAVEKAYTDLDDGSEKLRTEMDETREALEELSKDYKVPRPSTLAGATRETIVDIVEG